MKALKCNQLAEILNKITENLRLENLKIRWKGVVQYLDSLVSDLIGANIKLKILGNVESHGMYKFTIYRYATCIYYITDKSSCTERSINFIICSC